MSAQQDLPFTKLRPTAASRITQQLIEAYQTSKLTKTDDEAVQILKDSLLANSFSEQQADLIAPSLLHYFREAERQEFIQSIDVMETIIEALPDAQKEDQDFLSSMSSEASLTDHPLLLSDQDINWLKENLKEELNLNVSLLIVAFAAFARSHPHRSDWIHYDKKEIFSLAGRQIAKLSVKDQQSLTKEIHDKYGLNMQVVGSMQPIPCFQFDWQLPLSNSSQKLEVLGEYSHQTVYDFVINNLYNPVSSIKGEK